MSYEGYVEYLCERGHLSGADCYDDDLKVCRCGAPMAFRHAVDQTNGEIDDDPHTMPAPVREIGFDDDWKNDHHGNRYAAKLVRYEPVEHWRPINRGT